MVNVGLVTDSVNPERSARAAHECGLARAELSFDEHDIARRELCGELGSERLGLRGIACLVAL